MLRGHNPAEPIREERMYAGHFHEYTPAELAEALCRVRVVVGFGLRGAPDGREDSLAIRQDVAIYLATLDAGRAIPPEVDFPGLDDGIRLAILDRRICRVRPRHGPEAAAAPAAPAPAATRSGSETVPRRASREAAAEARGRAPA